MPTLQVVNSGKVFHIMTVLCVIYISEEIRPFAPVAWPSNQGEFHLISNGESPYTWRNVFIYKKTPQSLAENWAFLRRTRGRLNIKMSSYQYRDPHFKALAPVYGGQQMRKGPLGFLLQYLSVPINTDKHGPPSGASSVLQVTTYVSIICALCVPVGLLLGPFRFRAVGTASDTMQIAL